MSLCLQDFSAILQLVKNRSPVCAKVVQVRSTLCNPMDHTPHGILWAKILEWAAFPFPGDLPNPGIEARSPIFQVDSLPAEPQRKPLFNTHQFNTHPNNVMMKNDQSKEKFLGFF